MTALKLLSGFLKGNGIFCLVFFAVVVYVLFQTRSQTNSIQRQILVEAEVKHSKLIDKILKHNTLNSERYSKVLRYSKWPHFTLNSQEYLNELAGSRKFMEENCLNGSLSIETFDGSVEFWRKVSAVETPRCYNYLELFESLYEVDARRNKLSMPDDLAEKAKTWLNNSDELLGKVNNQKLLTVANKYTHEENVYNWLRSRRPSKGSSVSPTEFYKKTVNESMASCDFCVKRAAIGNFGRLSSKYSYSAANLFPFHYYHELFLPNKHDFLDLKFEEFNDLITLSSNWFNLVYQEDPSHKYRTLMWDLLAKAGASQTHPHLHGIVNKDHYYEMFEVIRNGAEAYYRVTNKNYFSDLVFIHNLLGLAHIHKGAAFIFPITPRVSYDAVIVSEDLNEGVIELIYAYLRTLMLDLEVFPFSLTIYYPSMDKTEREGRIPLYVKVMPRGDLSSIKSDASTLELMTINNVNADQFQVFKKTIGLLKKRLPN